MLPYITFIFQQNYYFYFVIYCIVINNKFYSLLYSLPLLYRFLLHSPFYLLANLFP